MKETTVFFGPERALVGTHAFADAAAGGAGDLGVVLTNAGLIARTGPHGINVRIARALARIGVPSIRFDLSGIGDSRRPAKPLPAEQQFVLDTRQALDEAQARHGSRRFAMIGFCSGADIAHMAALQDERLCGLLLWDPYIYPTLRSRIRHVHDRVQEFGLPGAVRRALWQEARRVGDWLKRRWLLAQGKEAPPPPTRFGRAVIPSAREYAGRLRQLLDRGVDITIVYSGGFPGDYNYPRQYRDSFKGSGIADRISCIYLRQADHILISGPAQQAVVRIVVDWVESLRAGSVSTPAVVAVQ